MKRTAPAPTASYGEDGADQLVGGDGDDRLDGGAGSDRLEGNLGLDSFYSCGADVDTAHYDGALDPATVGCEVRFPV